MDISAMGPYGEPALGVEDGVRFYRYTVGFLKLIDLRRV